MSTAFRTDAVSEVFQGGVPRLATERLVLRAPRIADAGAIAESLGDYEVSRMLSRVPSPYFRQDAVDWLERMEKGVGEGGFAFAVTIDDRLVGNIGLDRSGEGLRLGYWLRREFWRRGLMSEAVRAVLGAYFEARPDAAVRSGAFADNAASLGLQRKLGFVETGLSEVFSLSRGRSCSHVDTFIDAARLTGASGCRSA